MNSNYLIQNWKQIANFWGVQIYCRNQRAIENTLNESLNRNKTSKDYFEEMDPSEKTVGTFYQVFKTHKIHIPPALPHGRPIVSGQKLWIIRGL